MRLLVGFIAHLLAAPVFADPNEWQFENLRGPNTNLGGPVVELAVSPSGTEFITSSLRNFYTRKNRHEPWQQLSTMLDNGPAGIFPRDYVFDAQNPLNITATNSGDIISSGDGGFTWATVYNAPDSNSRIDSLYSKSSTAQDIYGWSNASSSITRSLDGGNTWAFVQPNNMSSLRDLVIDPDNNNVMYGLDSGRIKKSTDAGVNWMAMDEGVGSFWYMDELAINPDEPQTLYAASASFTTRFYKTSDGAASWSQLSVPSELHSQAISTMRIDSSSPNHLYAGTRGGGILETQDGGLSWSGFDSARGYGYIAHSAIQADGEYLLGSASGVATTLPDGTVVDSNLGFSDFPILHLSCASDTCDHLYASSRLSGLIYRTPETNAEWHVATAEFTLNAYEVEIDSSDSNHVWAATTSGLYESSDGGLTWGSIPLPPNTYDVHNLEISTSNSNLIFVQSYYGLYSTSDNGANWDSLLGPAVFGVCCQHYPLHVSSSDSQVITMGTYDAGVYHSEDGGQTWTQTNDNIFSPSSVGDIAVDPNNPDTLYMIDRWDSRLWKSTDFGASWDRFTSDGLLGFNSHPRIIVDSFVEGRLFVMPERGVLFVYEPYLGVWRQIVGEADNNYYAVNTLVLDPQRQGRIYANIEQQLGFVDIDSDGDGVIESEDNCTFSANADQSDTDDDGVGNLCDPDLSNNGVVNFQDLSLFASRFQSNDPDADFNGDGTVDFSDLDILKEYFTLPPGPGAQGNVESR